MRAAVALLMLLGVAAWMVGCVAMAGAESAAARAVDGALLLVDVGALLVGSYIVWPRRR